MQISPEEFRKLSSDMTADELNSWKVERYACLTFCLIVLIISIYALIKSIIHGHTQLTSIYEVGSAGLMSGSLSLLLLFVGKTRKVVKEKIEMYLKAFTSGKNE